MLNFLTLNTSKRCLFDYMVKRTYCQALYTQGQRVDKKIREYFYYIDQEGMVNNILFYFWKFSQMIKRGNYFLNVLKVMVKLPVVILITFSAFR